jgi:hypothetical protein
MQRLRNYGHGARDPRGRQRAEKIKEQREPEILRELLTAPSERVTWAEAAADYGAKRTQERVARNPALAGQPDKELEYVDKWLTFFEREGLATSALGVPVRSYK